jgi:superkiller protein 3
MSSTKAVLKAINAAIVAKKWEDAVAQAEKLLVADPKSYQG